MYEREVRKDCLQADRRTGVNIWFRFRAGSKKVANLFKGLLNLISVFEGWQPYQGSVLKLSSFKPQKFFREF